MAAFLRSWLYLPGESHLHTVIKKGEAEHKRTTEESQDASARDVCPVKGMICTEIPHPSLPVDGGRRLLQTKDRRGAKAGAAPHPREKQAEGI